MRLGKFIELNKEEMCEYICSRFIDASHMWESAKKGIDPTSMLGIHLPESNPKRKIIKRLEREAHGLFRINVGRNLDLYFLNASGHVVGCFWYYGGLQGKFAVSDHGERKKEVLNIRQMFEIYASTS